MINRGEAERISLDAVCNSLREYLSNRQITEIPLEDPGIFWDIDTIPEHEQIKGFLIPGYIAIRTINPASSIMLEGLKVAYVLSICEKRKEHWISRRIICRDCVERPLAYLHDDHLNI